MAGVACGKFDVSALGQNEYVVSTDEKNLWMVAEVEEKIIIIDGTPYVVIKFPNKLEAGFCEDVNNLNFAIGWATQLLKKTGSSPTTGPNNDHKAKALDLTVAEKNNVKAQQAAVGASDMNMMGFAKPAIMPAAAVIPMKSNIFTYGPYVTSNFTNSNGGTSIQTNPELCPWVFGSLEDMNEAGQSLVESVALGLLKAETGAVTLPGLPLGSLSNLGAQVAGTGPNLSSISFTFGSNGVTTNYQFATYTPKFGSLTNSQLETMKTFAKNRQNQLKFLRSQAITQNKISRQLARNSIRDAKAKGNENKPANRKNTVQRLLVGEMYGFQIGGLETDPRPVRTAVVMTDLLKSTPEMFYDYNKKAYFSLDGLFSPVSYSGASGNLPGLASFPKVGEGQIWDGAAVAYKASGHPQPSQPPFALSSGLLEPSEYNLPIDSRFEKAMTNKASLEFHYHNDPSTGAGHTIEFVGRENSISGDLPDGLSTNMYPVDDASRYSSDYRFLSLKGPLMLHSWGFDTNGKPIPNYVDTEANASSGIFQASGVKNRFLNNWLQNPKTWPVAPIDLRFDRSRGVWVSPPPYKIVAARLIQSLAAYSGADAVILNTRSTGIKNDAPIFDNDGNIVVSNESTNGAFIKVVDRLGQSFSAGTKCYVSYDPFNSEYIILGGATEQCSLITGRASGDYTTGYSGSQQAAHGEFYFPPVAFGTDDYGDTGYGIKLYPVFTGVDGPRYITDKPVDYDEIKTSMGLGGIIGGIRNPLGFAASSGDFVTVQRASYLDSIPGTTTPTNSVTDQPIATPQWIIISVGRGPYLTYQCGGVPATPPMPPESYP